MAAHKLNPEQRETLLTWLAAEYDTRLILQWFKERGWPEVSRDTISHYRTTNDARIEEIRKARRDSALNRGLALKEERVARLSQHADELESIKWQPDDKGRLWNEKAWRETLDDIARETGGRVAKVDHTGSVDMVVREYPKGV